MTAHDDPNNPMQGPTATACWSMILSKVRKERNRLGLGKTGTAVSGPEFFGYAMPEIAACIEGLDGAETCKNYVCRCLRMDSIRKGKSRIRRPMSEPFVIDAEQEVEERPSKRRAAQAASQRWKMMEEDESSAEFSGEEDESSDADLDSEEDLRTLRRSRKRMEETTEDITKKIKTEQLI